MSQSSSKCCTMAESERFRLRRRSRKLISVCARVGLRLFLPQGSFYRTSVRKSIQRRLDIDDERVTTIERVKVEEKRVRTRTCHDEGGDLVFT
jgi:hypothetical protein